MADSQRIGDLRRRVQKDPASIAFAQLAEELRRSGALQEAVDTCRAGLAIHPSYLSARVTLGRALLELNQFDGAQSELERVLHSAPENLAARRGLGEICSRRGSIEEALKQYRAALALAPNDPDLEETVAELSRQLEARPTETPEPLPIPEIATAHTRTPESTATLETLTSEAPTPADAVSFVPLMPGPADRVRDHATRTVAALETWLDAIDVSRTDRRA